MTVEGNRVDGQNTEPLKALERFVVDNDDLLELESRIAKFNIFDALGIARAEIRHSNFLAFILDPAESHGQGQLFLKAVLMDLLKEAPSELRPLSPIALDGADLHGVEVRREWKNIDLLITSKEPRFAVVIENKVGAREHSDQLGRYRQTMTDHHPGLPALYVYLTPDGEEPSDESWCQYSYRNIHRVLKRVREMRHNAIGDDVLVFLDHYLSLLEARIMNDDKLDELCRQIYKTHRQALDLIWERAGGPESAALDEVENVLKQDGRWEVIGRSNRYLDLVPKAWLGWLPKFGPQDRRYYSIIVNLRAKETKLVYTLFVGPMDNPMRRKEIVTKLREEGPGLGFKRSRASQVEGTWNRITATESITEWGEDPEPDLAAIRTNLRATLDKVYPKMEKLALVLKPLCDPGAPGS
jgi:hypothetical protein